MTRSEGKNLSNFRLEIQYIILGVDHLSPPPPIFEMINYKNFFETPRKDFFKGSKHLKKQNTENKLHTKLEAQVSLYRSPDINKSS
jgi:hypothetical protein